jgi:hypothetical protein
MQAAEADGAFLQYKLHHMDRQDCRVNRATLNSHLHCRTWKINQVMIRIDGGAHTMETLQNAIWSRLKMEQEYRSLGCHVDNFGEHFVFPVPNG